LHKQNAAARQDNSLLKPNHVDTVTFTASENIRPFDRIWYFSVLQYQSDIIETLIAGFFR